MFLDYKLVGPNGSTCINGNWKPSFRQVSCVKEEAKAGGDQKDSQSPLTASASAYHSNKIILFKEKNKAIRKFNTSSESKLKRLKKHKLKKNAHGNVTASLKQNQRRSHHHLNANANTNRKRINHIHERKTFLNN
jgi:hypothetical protein